MATPDSPRDELPGEKPVGENSLRENPPEHSTKRAAPTKRPAATKRPASTKRRLSARKKLLFSAIVTVLFFGTLELALTLLGVGRSIDHVDPFVGFDQTIPLMKVSRDESGKELVQTAPNKLVWFNKQSFPRVKAEGTRRVFCLGGSTTYGRPFLDNSSFAGWLRECLPLADPSCRWEVINAGGISYASYRVASVMEELCQYEPDLFIVYTGQNEFLERRTYDGMFQGDWRRSVTSPLRRTRVWSVLESAADRFRTPQAKPDVEVLPGEVDEMLNHSVGPQQYDRDPVWQSGVLRHFEVNLDRMVSMARTANVELLFVTPASNEKDCSPFKSLVDDELDDAGRAEFATAMDIAEHCRAIGEDSLALAAYQDAADIDSRHAGRHYGEGRVLQSMGRYAEAADAFKRAIEEDVCPLRAVKSIGDALRRVSDNRRVPLLDFESRLRDRCFEEFGHRNLGGEYFLDHVHPNVEVHRSLALWIIEAMREHDIADTRTLSEDEVEAITKRVRGRINRPEMVTAFRNLTKVLHWSGKFAEAIPRARDALRMNSRDLESRFLLAECLINTGEFDEGMSEYEQLFRDGDFPRAYLPYGEALADDGQLRVAENFLMMATVFHQTDTKSARAHLSLGRVYLALQEYDSAIEVLTVANDLFPEDWLTLRCLAEANAAAGNLPVAIEQYQRLARMELTSGEWHYRVGMLQLKQERVDDAINSFEKALVADPAHEAAGQNLKIARAIQG